MTFFLPLLLRLRRAGQWLLAAGLCAQLAQPAAAQAPAPAAPPPPPAKGGNVLKIAPLGWIHGQLPFTTEWRIGYERRIAPRATLGVSYSYLGTNYPFSFIGAFALSTAISAAITSAGHPGIVWTDARVRAHGARYQAQYRQYLSRKRRAPEGWYLSPHFSYAEVTYDVRVEDLTAQIDLTNRTYDLLFGHQRVLGQHFVFDIFTGLGYRDKRTVVRGLAGVRPDERLSASHFKLSSGLNLGWAF